MSEFKWNWLLKYFDTKDKLVVFDIGTWQGDEALQFARALPNSVVHTFEASKFVTNKYLVPRKAEFDALGVQVNNFALSSFVGSVKFYESDSKKAPGKSMDASSSILAPTQEGRTFHPDLEFKEPVVVPCMPISAYCASKGVTRLDVIHMDVQGAEMEVLKGLGEFRPKIIFCETCEFDHYEGAGSLAEFDAFMAGLGYRVEERLEFDTLYVR